MKRSPAVHAVLTSPRVDSTEAARLAAADPNLAEDLLNYLHSEPDSAVEAARAIHFFGLRRRGLPEEVFRDAMLAGLAADDARVAEPAARIAAVALLLDSRPGGMRPAIQLDLRRALARALESHALAEDVTELARRACDVPQ